jgi:thiol-disulfide isomerase/thioredoxin
MMMKPVLSALLFPALLLSALPATAATAPRMAIQTLAELPTPLPYPYDEKADADKAVAAGKALARRSGRKLLVDMGGNWCGDCRILAALMERPELKAFLAKHYVIVTVDVGRMNKNLQIPGHYGIAKLSGGVPALMIINPRTDKLINGAQLSALEDARHMIPQALADWLAQWV